MLQAILIIFLICPSLRQRLFGIVYIELVGARFGFGGEGHVKENPTNDQPPKTRVLVAENDNRFSRFNKSVHRYRPIIRRAALFSAT